MKSFIYSAPSGVLYALFGTNGTAYVYDDIGNHSLYPANSLNQYLDSGIEYDLDGNMTRHGDMDFTWDAENRLVSVANGTTNIVNAYDYKHRRIRKTVNGESRTFVYDGWNLISETTSVEARHYFWGLDLSDSLQGAGGVGGLLAVSQGGSMYYPVYDNNGNVTVYLDDSGNIVAAYEYNAFGETITQSGGMANEFKFRFSTKYHDGETGLYYYGYRFYSPVLRTWLNRDLIEEEGGLNLYGFCRNNGINQMDNLGLRIKTSALQFLSQPNIPGRLRGLTQMDILEEISVSCVNPFKAQLSGAMELRLHLLQTGHELWNMRYSRYDKKWGMPRGNQEERSATYAHEMDHYKTFVRMFEYIDQFNDLENGLFCCSEKKKEQVRAQIQDLIQAAKAHADSFDRALHNYGGAYENNPFVWK